MNSSFFFTLTALAISALSAEAQTTLNTIPEGMLTLSLPATTSAPFTAYFSLPLTADPVYSGAVSAITASGATTSSGLSAGFDTIAVTVDGNDPAPFVNGTVGVQLASLATPALPYFVKFLSGAETGRVIKVNANTSSTLTLDTTDNSTQVTDFQTTGFAVAVGDTFEVFPACTLGSLFGDNTTNNPVLLHGGSEFAADSVSLYNPITVRFKTYFFNTTAGYWELDGTSVNANNTILYPYGALAILHRGSQPAVSIAPMARELSIAATGDAAANIMVPVGRVAEVPIITKTTGSGLVVYGSTTYPVDMTLSQLVLGANWTKGTSAFNSDTVSIYNATTLKFNTYYQLASNSQWRQLGASASTDMSGVVIPAGTGIAILQRGNVSLTTSFLSSVMPYSVN